MSTPNFVLEQQYDGLVCGIDEAGRGPWAGPVVAAALVWPSGVTPPVGLNDSKKLSESKREALFEQITKTAFYGIGQASVAEIDQTNILAATKLAMQRAYDALCQPVSTALVDGNQPPTLPCHIVSVVKGDSKSLSIAAASILAKVTRDRLMVELAQQHPHHGFAQHKGYGTKQHQEALAAHGVTPHHRTSFAPIRSLLQTKESA